MRYRIAAHTDIGIRKQTNQDSVLIHLADTPYGPACLAVICDGMGGLANGELASASVIRAFSNWFRTVFPTLIAGGDWDDLRLERSWDDLLHEQNDRITEYGMVHHSRMGTTAVSLLLFQNRYHVANVGDSRAYCCTAGNIVQLTKDQSFVQREIDLGRLTPEQARNHPQRSVLLQCIGASDFIDVDFFHGSNEEEAVFFLCSDGFRHVVTEEEIFAQLNPRNVRNEEEMQDRAVYLTDLNKFRKESDNISVALVRTSGEDVYA